MKKILSLLLALSLLFALIGCKPAGELNAPLQPELQMQTTEATEDVTVESTAWLVEWPTEAPTEETETVPEMTQPPREEEIIDSRPHPADVAEQDQQQDQDEQTNQHNNLNENQQQNQQPNQDKQNPQPNQDKQNQQSNQDKQNPQPNQDKQNQQPDQDKQNQQPDQDDQGQQQDRDEQPEQPSQRPEQQTPVTPTVTEPVHPIDPDGWYNDKNSVALYIHTFGWLPGNYISKDAGDQQYGSYKNIPSNRNIGGDVFKNREGLLPRGYTYYECDIGTFGGRNRGVKRIVFTTSGIVYYTNDHYESFTRLY